MAWQDNVRQVTKNLNAAIDGVEKFIQQMVDTKIKKIDDYGKKITAYFDADFKLIETACYFLIHANEEQMKDIISYRGPEPLMFRAIASPNGFELEYPTTRMKLMGYVKGNPNPKLFSIEKKNDTYFTPSDLVLSNSEAAQIRNKVKAIDAKTIQDFSAWWEDLKNGKQEPVVLDYFATQERWNKINVPESQLIQTYSLPLKQKALIWDLKIDMLVDRRNDALKQANRDAKADFAAKKIFAYSLDRRWIEEPKQDPIDLGDGPEGETPKIRELYSQVNELYAQIEKVDKGKPKGPQICIEGVESSLEKASKQTQEIQLKINKLYDEIRSQEHELLKGGK